MSSKIHNLLIGAGVAAGFALGSFGVLTPRAHATPPSADGRGDTTAYDFEDDLVRGDLVRPDGEVLLVRKRGTRDSLVRVRTQYVPELLKSAENL